MTDIICYYQVELVVCVREVQSDSESETNTGERVMCCLFPVAVICWCCEYIHTNC